MSVSAHTPDDHADQVNALRRVVRPRAQQQLGPEVRRTRGLPFAQVVTQWVRDPRYSTNLRTLYSILVTYADVSARDTSKGRPYRSVLAFELGCTTKTLDRTIREGEVAGLFRVEHRTDPKNSRSNDANVYHLRDSEFWAGEWVDPLDSEDRAADVAEQRQKQRGLPARGGRKKATLEDGVGTPVSPGGRDMDVPRGRDTSDARGGDTDVPLGLEPLVESLGLDLSLSPLDQNLTYRASAVSEAAKAAERESGDGSGTQPQTPQEPLGGPQEASTGPDPAQVVLGAYEGAAGRQLLGSARDRMLRAAATFLEAGYPVGWLADRAAEMPANGWTNLAKHVEHSSVPIVDHDQAAKRAEADRSAAERAAAARRAAIAACDQCDSDGLRFNNKLEVVGCLHDGQAQPDSGGALAVAGQKGLALFEQARRRGATG